MTWLTTGQAAARMGVSESTIRAYLEAGLLQGHKLPSGHRRIESSSVDYVKTVRDKVSSTVTIVKAGA